MQAIDQMHASGDLIVHEDIDQLKRLSMLKHKDILKDTLQEFQRKGHYLCIYPAKGSQIYD